jgi:hypothetical protein
MEAAWTEIWTWNLPKKKEVLTTQPRRAVEIEMFSQCFLFCNRQQLLLGAGQFMGKLEFSQ